MFIGKGGHFMRRRDKRLIKKVLSAILSAVMVMSVTVTAFADDAPVDHVTVDAEEGESKTENVGDVDHVINSEDDQPWAVQVEAYGGSAQVTTGDVKSHSNVESALAPGVVSWVEDNGSANVETGNITASNGGYGLNAYAGEGSTNNIKTGSVTTDNTGANFESEFGGQMTAEINGDINAGLNGVTSRSYDENSETEITVNGNITAEHAGALAYAYDGGFTFATINGNINAEKEGANSYTRGKDSISIINVNGNVTVTDHGTYPGAVQSLSDEGGSSLTVVNGDVTNTSGKGAAIYLRADSDSFSAVGVDGTAKGGEIPVVVEKNTDLNNINVAVWKVEANDQGQIGGVYDRDTGIITYSRAVEETINYIIKLEDNSDASLSAVETAHEGEKVILNIDVNSGYELKGAYNGMGEKVPLQKDNDGNWYVIVPKGGGVYLSVKLYKIEKDNSDKKDDNVLTWTAANNAGTAAYASLEAFGAAGVSMISSAASGATVTIDATSFTSLPASIVAALMMRPDVTFIFTYMLNGVKYTVTIPAGTNLAGLMNASGGIDFASLASFTTAG
jgi:hypothetical protein